MHIFTLSSNTFLTAIKHLEKLKTIKSVWTFISIHKKNLDFQLPYILNENETFFKFYKSQVQIKRESE